jgi:hypothetical protein
MKRENPQNAMTREETIMSKKKSCKKKKREKKKIQFGRNVIHTLWMKDI